MYSTQVYLYNQKHVVLLSDDYYESAYDLRWRPVYSKNLKLNKGVDNVILFQFLNQNQKPVDLSDSELTFRLLDQEGQQVLLTLVLEVVNAAKGKARLAVRATDTYQLPPQVCSYSVTRARTEEQHLPDSAIIGVDLVEATYVDDHAGARGVIEVLDSVLPTAIPSTAITIPNQYQFENEPLYSSTVSRATNGITTFQVFFDQFAGTIQVEGSVSPYGSWIECADTAEVTDQQSICVNGEGHFNQLRLKIISTAGSITKILAR